MGFGNMVLARGGRQPLAACITECIAEMLAPDDQPFSMVNNVGFKHHPRYNIRS